jgi:hypothetical protein
VSRIRRSEVRAEPELAVLKPEPFRIFGLGKAFLQCKSNAWHSAPTPQIGIEQAPPNLNDFGKT